MIRAKKLPKLILVNFLVLLLCFSLLALAPPALSDAFRYLQTAVKKIGLFNSKTKEDPRALLPNYENSKWAGEHFKEFDQLTSTYFDYIGWRRKPFSGKTINVDPLGYRQNSSAKISILQDSKIWVFGGSTIWGSGARDFESIPAFLEQATQSPTFNFGESGYVAHQNLNLLMKAYLDGGRPQNVIFYDGVNEVLHKCRSMQTPFSTAYEGKIRWQIEENFRLSSQSLWQVFAPSTQVLQKLFASIYIPSTPAAKYSCDIDSIKTQKIAEGLVNDWKTARFIAESNGAKFSAILQASAYTGQPNLQHLKLVTEDSDLRNQFNAVYPAIRQALKSHKFPYLDFSDVFNGDQHFYIDGYHVSPNGNELVAQKIAQHLAKLIRATKP